MFELFFFPYFFTHANLIFGFRGRRSSMKIWRILGWTPEYQMCDRFRHMYMSAIIIVSKVVVRCYIWVYESNGYQNLYYRLGNGKNGPQGGKI